MKRSRSVKLMTMGASVLALTACGESEQQAGVFSSVSECVRSGVYTKEQCDAAAKQAREQHPKVAPKYKSVADCEADFGAGKCQEAPYRTSSGGLVWMPFLVGYMMASRMGPAGRFGSQPLYRSKDDPGRFRTANNQPIPGKTGIVKVPASATRPPANRLYTSRRGGFGASARTLTSRARAHTGGSGRRGYRGFGG